MARKSKGRQKIEMRRMSKESNLLVTFSKRRYGLFKKAYELCTLCGAQLSIIVFSPGKKVFSYGHPNVYSIVDRFVNRTTSSAGGTTSQLVEAHRNASARELNMQLTEMLNQLDAEKKRGEELAKIRKASQGRCWWEGPLDKHGLRELEQLKEAMEELKKNVAKLILEASTAAFQLGAAAAAASSRGGHVGVGGSIEGTANTLGYAGRRFF